MIAYLRQQTDGQTDTTKIGVAIRNFENAPKNHASFEKKNSAFYPHTISVLVNVSHNNQQLFTDKHLTSWSLQQELCLL